MLVESLGKYSLIFRTSITASQFRHASKLDRVAAQSEAANDEVDDGGEYSN